MDPNDINKILNSIGRERLLQFLQQSQPPPQNEEIKSEESKDNNSEPQIIDSKSEQQTIDDKPSEIVEQQEPSPEKEEEPSPEKEEEPSPEKEEEEPYESNADILVDMFCYYVQKFIEKEPKTIGTPLPSYFANLSSDDKSLIRKLKKYLDDKNKEQKNPK